MVLFSGTNQVFSAVAAPPATASITLAWNASSSPDVVGYRIYYGGGSGNYTNSMTFGNVTSGTISNLLSGATYYFAIKAFNAAGVESTFSNEIAYTIPGGAANLQLLVLASKQVRLTITGSNGHTYQVQASTNLTSWNTLSTLTVGPSGTTNYTDTTAPGYAKRFYRTRDLTP